MRCPLCAGEFDGINLKTINGQNVPAKQCTECGGIWLDRPAEEPLHPESVSQYDSPVPNYSLKTSDLFCPIDETILSQSDDRSSVAGLRYWHCIDCGGLFFAKGQLALLTNAQASSSIGPLPKVTPTRAKIGVASALLAVLFVAVLGSVNRINLTFSAATTTVSPLPTSGPNVTTLVLLALAYLAGTVLAVLGRKLPIIIAGWSVITVCMLGFAVVIFGP